MNDQNSYQNRPNRGAMFINHNKQGQSHPDRLGRVNIDGVDYWISGWIKRAQSGKRAGETYMSLAVRRQEDYGSSGKQPPNYMPPAQAHPHNRDNKPPQTHQNNVPQGNFSNQSSSHQGYHQNQHIDYLINDDIPF